MNIRKNREKQAIQLVKAAAEQAVAEGRYPTVEIALYEMAANQRRATIMRVDLHDLIKKHEREKGTT